MRGMDITDARTFIAVAETGSISRAARELHLTQPAVTRRIQRLEHAIGTRLIDRRKRPFALTDVGHAAIERCRRLVSTRDELKALAQGGAALPTRECRIGVAHALTELALTEPVDELRDSFPAVVLRLSTGWSRDLAERVRSGALDAAVVLLPRGDGLPAGVEGRDLASEQLQVIAPRAGRSRHATTLKELAASGWILNPEGCAARATLQKAFAKAGLPLRVGVETYNYELQMSLVARGRGFGLVPGRLVTKSTARAALSVLDVRALDFPMTVWLLTAGLPSGLEAALTAFADSLQRRLAPKSKRSRK
jgi:DNA-binding transcriptional LysR family regulator